ncbi:MAG: hypothetical protein K5894_14350 [Lachnospiraceae bacterium]|nr:hypothetical protein [Lachnospiraceae bacterium]
MSIKKQTVRPNTVGNYSERYERNIKDIIGNKLLADVKPILLLMNQSVSWRIREQIIKN